MLGNLLKHLLRRDASQPAVEQTQAVHASADWLSAALELRQQGRNRDIATMCRAVLKSQPHNIDALNFLAAALLAQGELDEGKDCLRQVLRLAPESAETHANLAAALAASGDMGPCPFLSDKDASAVSPMLTSRTSTSGGRASSTGPR